MALAGFRQRLLAGESLLGVFTPSRDAGVAEFLSTRGWDFLLLDGEHGAIGPAETANLCRAAELHGTAALVRVPGIHQQLIGQHLDMGAAGIMAPMVESAAEAEALVAACRYPPAGARGLSGTRASAFARGPALGAHTVAANAEVVTIAQIETAKGLANLPAIAAVEGIDLLFIGAADLSASLGHPMEMAHPDVLAAIRDAAAGAQAAGKPAGLLIESPEQLQIARFLGATLVATYLEALLDRATTEWLATRSA